MILGKLLYYFISVGSTKFILKPSVAVDGVGSAEDDRHYNTPSPCPQSHRRKKTYLSPLAPTLQSFQHRPVPIKNKHTPT